MVVDWVGVAARRGNLDRALDLTCSQVCLRSQTGLFSAY